MAYEDTSKSYIEILIENKQWVSAYNCLQAYINEYSEDRWAKNMLALVKDNLQEVMLHLLAAP